MISRFAIWALVLVGVLVYVGTLPALGPAMSISDLAAPLPRVVSVIAVSIWLFDRYLWRIPILHPLVVRVPDLNGTWKGELRSNYPHAQPALRAYLSVRQTLTRVQARLMTETSASDLITGSVFIPTDGDPTLVCVYRAAARLLGQRDNPPHRGTLMLEIHEGQATVLAGDYWTDRDTKGEARFSAHSPRQSRRFDEAAQLFDVARRTSPGS